MLAGIVLGIVGEYLSDAKSRGEWGIPVICQVLGEWGVPVICQVWGWGEGYLSGAKSGGKGVSVRCQVGGQGGTCQVPSQGHRGWGYLSGAKLGGINIWGYPPQKNNKLEKKFKRKFLDPRGRPGGGGRGRYASYGHAEGHSCNICYY